MTDDREHTEDCPRDKAGLLDLRFYDCPNCGEPWFSPEWACEECGYAVCWCVGDDGGDDVVGITTYTGEWRTVNPVRRGGEDQ